MAGLFLETCGNTPVILESGEHALNDMAFFVLIPVTTSLNLAVGFGRDDGRQCMNFAAKATTVASQSIRIPAIFFRLTNKLSHSLSLSLLLSMPTKRVGVLLVQYVNRA